MRTDEHGTWTAVRVGDRWWSYHPRSGATSNEDDTSVRLGTTSEIDSFLDPALLLGGLNLEVGDAGEAAGRPAALVHGTARLLDEPYAHLMRPALPGGADTFELLVDDDRGVVLRLEARIDGEAFHVIEVVEIAFDESFPDEVFVFEAPAGEAVRSHREAFGPPEAMSLEEAVRRAQFTVLAPRRLPEGWGLNVLFMPERERPPMPSTVLLHVTDPTQVHQLRIAQGASQPIPDSVEWTEAEYRGDRYLVREGTGPLDGEIEIKLVREGTHARITGNLQRSAMLEIAASLHRASPELPPLTER